MQHSELGLSPEEALIAERGIWDDRAGDFTARRERLRRFFVARDGEDDQPAAPVPEPSVKAPPAPSPSPSPSSLSAAPSSVPHAQSVPHARESTTLPQFIEERITATQVMVPTTQPLPPPLPQPATMPRYQKLPRQLRYNVTASLDETNMRKLNDLSVRFGVGRSYIMRALIERYL